MRMKFYSSAEGQFVISAVCYRDTRLRVNV
jgi:hypothetical protein